MILQSRTVRPAVVALVTLALGALVGSCDKVPLLAPSGSTISVYASQTVLPVNGSTDVTATVIESSGTPVQNGTLVTFRTSLGSFEPYEARTHNGSASVRFHAGSVSGIAQIQAFSGGSGSGTTTTTTATTTTSAGGSLQSGSVQIVIGAAAAANVQVSASPARVPATGGTVQITALVTDGNGNRLPGVPVGFSIDSQGGGQLGATSVTTNDQGEARTTLTTTVVTTVTARAGTVTASVAVAVNPVPVITVTAGANPVVGAPATITVTPGQGQVLQNVQIDFGDGQTQSLGTLTSARGVAHDYCSPRGYTVTVTGTDQNGVRATGSAVIVATPLTIAIGPATGQVNRPVVFTATVPQGALVTRFQWDFGDQQTQTTTGPTVAHNYTRPGGYEVKVTAFGQTCGQATAQTSATITP
jgi:hypothetical protein